MARTFATPENLDISYKFIGGKYSVKDMLYRAIGIPPAMVFGFLVVALTENTLWAVIVAAPWLVVGFLIGGSKVFDGSMLFINALLLERKLKNKKIKMVNKRSSAGDFEGVTT